MTVTRRTAQELRAGRPKSGRSTEAIALLAVALLWTFGLFKVYSAVSADFEETTERLQRQEIVNLQQLTNVEDLSRVLDPLPESERSFIAEKIFSERNRLGRTFANVGALSAVRVDRASLDGGGVPADLRTKLLERAEKSRSKADPPLLSTRELQSIKPSLIARPPEAFHQRFLSSIALIFGAFLITHLFLRWRDFRGDPWILPILFSLAGLGFIEMVSLRDPLRDQMIFTSFAEGVAGGCLVLLVASQFDFTHRIWRKLAFIFLLLAIVLSVLLIFFGTGPGQSDAKVNLAGVQPVEAIKVLLVFFLAGYFCERWEFLRELQERRGRFARILKWLQLPKLEYFLPVILAMGLVLLFFFFQRDLGPALVMSLLFLILYSIARDRIGLALLGLGILVAGFTFGYQMQIPRTVATRVKMWLAPWNNDFANGDHLAKTLWAFASGGFSGIGLGRGDTQLVPAAHTDMILAAIGEELGFLGILLVLTLFSLLIFRFLRTARRTAEPYSFFLALGITLVLALQTLLIACGVLGVLPLSGVTTPFLSFGRSSLLASFAVVGVLMAISHRVTYQPGQQTPFQKGVVWVAVGLSLGLCAVTTKAAKVQILDADTILIRPSQELQADGVRRKLYNPRLRSIGASIPRGSIVDREGRILATSRPEEVSPAIAEEVANDGERIYPLQGLTYHLTGDLNRRLDWAARNNSFVERDFRVQLQGFNDEETIVEILQTDGSMRASIARDYSELIALLRHKGDPDHPEVKRILERDRTLYMTVDAKLQEAVSEILKSFVKRAGSKAGAAVVIEAESGALLASVSYPWPEDATPSGEQRLDRARYGIYPPGSTFKLVSAMAALTLQPENAEKTFKCQPVGGGRVGMKIRGWGKPIRDDPTARRAHGDVNLHRGIRDSCNAYFAQLVHAEVGASHLLETSALFGIDAAKPNRADILRNDLPQAAFGQGQVTATPLQMARVVATIANDGRMPDVHWVQGTSDPEQKRILPGPAARKIAEGMRAAVRLGTAKSLKDIVPSMAGKTGTAEVAGKASHSWFVGYAPFSGSGPKIAFSVLIEHGGYGGRNSAVAAGEIVRRAASLGIIQGGDA